MGLDSEIFAKALLNKERKKRRSEPDAVDRATEDMDAPGIAAAVAKHYDEAEPKPTTSKGDDAQ